MSWIRVLDQFFACDVCHACGVCGGVGSMDYRRAWASGQGSSKVPAFPKRSSFLMSCLDFVDFGIVSYQTAKPTT